MISSLHALNSLSLWEIGLRLNNLDPDEENETTISVETRNTLRTLMWAMGTHLNIQDKDGNELLPTYIPFFKIIRDHPVELRLKSDVATRTIEKKFLDTVFIDKDEFEYWHLIEDWAVPEFWFRSDEVEYHNKKRNEAFRRDNHSSTDASFEDECTPCAEDPIDPPLTPKQQQSEAATQKHAERNRICEQFAASLERSLTAKEINAAAVEFYEQLKETQKLELARSPDEFRRAPSAKRISNGVRTLVRFVNRKCKPPCD